MPAKILLLSGASEGPVLARALLDADFAVIATVTTEAAVQVCRDLVHRASSLPQCI